MLLTDWLRALRRPRNTFRLSHRDRNLRSTTSQASQSQLPRSVDLLEQRTMLTVAPVSDVIASAVTLDLNAGESTQFHAEIGDEASIDLDVDVYQVDLLDGQELTVDIDAIQLDDLTTSLSSLDSYIRIFSSDGTQLDFNDNGIDPDTALAGNDAFLSFIAPATGTYFIGVSSAANTVYDPDLSESGVSGSTGEYYLQAAVGAAPAVSALRLESIQSSTDAVISGSVVNDLGTFMPSIEFDLDGDGVADESTSPDGANLFSKTIAPATVGDGLTVYVRATDFDFTTSTSMASPWYAVHVNYVAPVNEAPVISNLTLVNDTDMPGDMVTSDARVSGVLIDDVSNIEYTLEFDFDNDGNSDTSLFVNNGTSFTIDAATYLNAGPATVKVRGLEWDDYLQTTIAGDWYSLSFTYEPNIVAPEISTLQLTNDTDMPGDNVTTDPALNGQVSYAGDMMMMTVQVDTNGDQISDANATYDPAMGTFSYTPSGLAPGVHTISVRAIDDMAMITGNWSSITFTLEEEMAGAGPEISTLQLTNDTDMPGDNVTTDPALNGQVSYAGDMMMMTVQVDTNGDQISDANATYDPAMGTFSYTPSGLAPGVHTISVRAIDDMAMITGNWSSITFTLEEEMAGAGPEISTLQLTNDTDMPGDNVTTDPAINGQVSYAGDMMMMTVQVDTNGDQISDANATYDPAMGTFSYTPSGLAPGVHTISVRAIDDMAMITGNWSSITFTLEEEMAGAGPEISTLQLTNDTDMPGDNVTTDPAINGQVSYAGDMMMMTVQVDTNGDQISDANATYDPAMGTFSYTPSGLAPGVHTISVRAIDDMAMITGNWSSITFTLEEEMAGGVPEVTSLQLANDTDMPGDNVTTDPAITGQVSYAGGAELVTLDIDINGDGTIETSVAADMTGNFTFDPSAYVSAGPVLISVRPVDQMMGVFGQWANISYDLEEVQAGGDPEISVLSLSNDTGTPGDLITTDPTLSGQISYTGMMVDVALEFDVNGDGMVDATAWPDIGGNFSYNPSSLLTPGSVTVSVRAYDQVTFAYGAWSSITFTLEEEMAGGVPEITSLQLTNDTDMPGDNVTTDPAINGQVTYTGDIMAVSVEVDTNNDQVSDAYASFDPMMGTFTYTPSGLSPGVYTVAFRAVDPMAMIEGSWSNITFTLEDANHAPIVTSETLSAMEDGTTVITGILASDADSDDDANSLIYNITAQSTEGSAVSNGDGTFTFDPGADFQDLAAGETRQVTFTFTATDSHSAVSNTGTVTVTVTGVNDGPTVSAAVSSTVTEDDGTYSLDLLTHASDADTNDTLVISDLLNTLGDDSGITVNGNSLDIDPNAYNHLAPGESEVITFTYNVIDGNGGSVAQSASITITGVNDGPTVSATVSSTVTEDTGAYSLDLLTHASDADTNDTLAISDLLNTLGDDSGITVNGNSLDIDPHAYSHLLAGESEVITYTYNVIDGNGGSVAQTATITITGANDVPIVTDSTLAAMEDGTTVTTGVLASDADSDDDANSLVYNITTQPTEGSAVSNGDGTFTFDPSADFQDLAAGETREVTFSYTATDLHSAVSNTGTVTVTVTGVNDGPTVSAAISSTVTEDDGAYNLNLLTNASDVDTNDTLAISDLLNILGDDSGITVNGNSLDIDPNAYNHLAPGESEVITFTYNVIDGNGGSVAQSASITVTGVNDAPITTDDAFTTDEATVLNTGNVLNANPTVADTDPEGHVFTVTDVAGGSIGVPFALASGALLTLNSDGTFSYDPNGQFEYLAVNETAIDSFSYTVTDTLGASSTATVNITITGVNDGPTVSATVISSVTEDDGAYSLDLLTHASDADTNDTLAISDLLNTLGDDSGITVNGNSLDIDPHAYSHLLAGESEVITYTYNVIDGNGGSVAQTATITITGANDVPIVTDSTLAAMEDGTTITTGVLASDADSDDDANSLVYNITTQPTEGSAISNGDGTFTFDPGADFQDLAAGETRQVTFTFTATDSHSAVSNTGTVTVTVTGVNDGPTVSAAISSTVTEDDGAYNLDLLTNASDVDTNDTLAISDLLNTLGDDSGITVNGNSLDIDPNGYNHLAPGESEVITFTYNVIDGNGGSVAQSASITITGVNDAPVATDDAFTTDEASVLNTGNVLNANPTVADTDPEGHAFTVTDVAGGSIGVPFALASGALLTLNSDGTFSYDPNGQFEYLAVNETAIDSFSYTVTDTLGASSTATVNITITGVNDGPTVSATVSSTVTEDTGAYSLDLLTHASDADTNDTLAISDLLNTLGDDSGITVNGNSLDIDPHAYSHLLAGESEVITYTYNVIDGNGGSVAQTATITITGANDVPIVTDSTLAAMEDGTTITTGVLASDADSDDDANSLIYNITAQPTEGSAVSNGDGTFTFDPEADFQDLAAGETREVTFSYTATDLHSAVSNTGTVTVTVTGVNDGPTVSAAISSTVTEDDGAYNLNLLTNASDVDTNDTLTISDLLNTLGDDAGITVNGNSLDIDPNAYNHLAPGESEVISFTYNVIDGNGGSVAQSASITITGVNDGPTVSAAVSSTVTEDDGAYSLDLLTHASDADTNDTLAISDLLNTLGDDAGITVNGNSLDIDPHAYSHLLAGESEVITYTYNVIDGNGGTVAQTATITITGANDVPIVTDSTLAAMEDGSTVTTGVLASDADSDDDANSLVYSITTQPTEGSATSNGDGTFTFNPRADFQNLAAGETREVTFSYTATDLHSAVSNTGTVTVTVTGVNDDPIASSESIAATEDGPAVNTSVLTSDADSDDDVNSLVYTIVTQPSEGSATSNGDGTFTFDPGTDFQDLAAGETRQVTFSYTATDSHSAVSNTGTVTITVTGIDPQLLVGDITVNESTGVAVFTVTLTNSVASGVTVDWSTADDTALAGTDYIADSGTLNFTGTAGETQTISINLVKDLNIESAEQFLINLSNVQATVQNVILPDNQVVATITDNLPPQVESLDLAIDTDTQGDLITSYAHIIGSLTDADQTNSTYEIQVDYDNDGISDLSVNTDNLFEIDLASYLPDDEVTVQVRAGEWDSLSESDIYGDWSSLTFTYDSPLNEGTPFISGLSLVNDTDTAGDLITSDATITGLITDDGTNSEYILHIDVDNDGVSDLSVEQGADQQFTYNLGDDLAAGEHTIQVRAVGLSTGDYGYIYGVWSATTFTYNPPLEVDATIDSLTLVTDSGIDDDFITVDPIFTGEVSSISDFTNFTVELDFENDGIVDSTTTLDVDGKFTVDPGASITTGANTVAVRLVDNTTGAIGDWSTLSFELITLPAYTLANEFLSISQDTVATIPILENADYQDHISIAVLTSPVNGAFTNTANDDLTRTFTYTPNEGFTGTDTITYSVSDIQGNVSTATITFTIFANTAPTAEDDVVETYETDPVTVNLLANDSDPEGHAFSLISVEDPLYGTVEVNPTGTDPGTIVYTANEYFVGNEYLTYTIEDEHGRTTTAVLTIQVIERPAPEIVGLSLLEDTQFENDLLTVDATLTGEITSTRAPDIIQVQFDYDGDYEADATSNIGNWLNNSFTYDVGEDIAYGETSLYVRAVEIDENGEIVNFGDWNYIAFTYIEEHDPIPEFEEVDPNADLVTNFSADLVTDALVRLVGQVANTNGGDEPIVEFDFDLDLIIDATTTVTAGAFSQEFTTEIGYGELIVLARTRDWDDVNQKFIYSEWTDLEITRDAPPNDPPVIAQVGLVEDTDVDGDGITSNSSLTGSITNSDGTVNNLIVEYDLDGDQLLEGFVYTSETGTGSFTIEFSSSQIPEGENTIAVRAREWDANIEGYVFSDWASVTFTYELPVEIPVGLDEIQLVVDTDTPDDLITTDPRISAIVTGDLSDYEEQLVLFDINLDGIADGSVDTIDPTTGEVIIDLTEHVDYSGEYLVYMKVWGWDDDTNSSISSDWTEFIFTYEAPVQGPPQVIDLALVNDTDTPDDDITTDPTLGGAIDFESSLLDSVLVEYDLDGDGVVDGSTFTTEGGSGTFELDLALHDLDFGSQTVAVRAGIWDLALLDFEYGDWSSITFTYEDPNASNELPQVTSLALVNDTGTPGDNITSNTLISGVVTDADSDLTGIPLEFDVNGDGKAEGTTYTDVIGAGEFSIDVSPYLTGEATYTVQVRAAQWNDSAGEYQFGDWSSITFTYEAAVFEDLDGSEDPGLEEVNPFTPEEQAHVEFYNDALGLSFTAETESPENAGVYHPEYDQAGDLVIDATFLASIGVVNTNDSTPYSDTITTTDANGNVTTVVISNLTTTTVTGAETVDGEWFRREEITSTYSYNTQYTGIDGSGYHFVQSGTYGYVIEAYGYSGNSTYHVTEYRTDAYTNDQWTAADPGTIYTVTGSQGFTIEASGYHKANEDGLIKAGSTFVATQLPASSPLAGSIGAPDVSNVHYSAADIGSRTSKSFTSSGSTGNGVVNTNVWSRGNTISTHTNSSGQTTTLTTFNYSNSIITPINVVINSNTTTQTNPTTSTTINHISSLTGSKVDIYTSSGSRTTFDDGTYFSTVTHSVTNNLNDTYSLDYTKTVNVLDNTVPGVSITGNATSNVIINRTRAYTYTVTTVTDRDIAGVVTVVGTIGGSNETNYSTSNTSSSTSSGTSTQGDLTLGFNTSTSGNATESGLIDVTLSGTFDAGYASLVTTKTVVEFSNGNTSSSNSASSSRVSPTVTANSSSSKSSNNTYSSMANITETNTNGVRNSNGSLSFQSIGGGLNQHDHTVTTNIVTPTSTSYSHAYDNGSSTFATTGSGNGIILNSVFEVTSSTNYRVPIGEGKFARGSNSTYSTNTTEATNPKKVTKTVTSGGSNNSTTGKFSVNITTNTHTIDGVGDTLGTSTYDESAKSKWSSHSNSLVTVDDTTKAGTTSYYSKNSASSDSGKGQYASNHNSNTTNDVVTYSHTHYEGSGNGNSSSSSTTSIGNITGTLKNGNGTPYSGSIDQSTVNGMIDGSGGLGFDGYDNGNNVSQFNISTIVETVQTGTFYKYDQESDITDGAGTYRDDNSANTTTKTNFDSSSYSKSVATPQTGLTKTSTSTQIKSAESLKREFSSSNVNGTLYVDGSIASTTTSRYRNEIESSTSDATESDQEVDLVNVDGVSGDRSVSKESSVTTKGNSQRGIDSVDQKEADGSTLSSSISAGTSTITSTTNSSELTDRETTDSSKPNVKVMIKTYQYSDVVDNIKTIVSADFSEKNPVGTSGWSTENYVSSADTSFDNSDIREVRVDPKNYERNNTASQGSGTTLEVGSRRNDTFANGTSSANSHFYQVTGGNSESQSIKDTYKDSSKTVDQLKTSGNSHVHDEYETLNVVTGSTLDVSSNTPVNGSETVTTVINSWSSGEDKWNFFDKSHAKQEGSKPAPQDPTATIKLDLVTEDKELTRKGGGTFFTSDYSNTTTTKTDGGESSSSTSTSNNSSSYKQTIVQDNKTKTKTTTSATHNSKPVKIIRDNFDNKYTEIIEKMTVFTNSSTNAAGQTTTTSGTTAQDPDSSGPILEDVEPGTGVVDTGPVAQISGNSNWESKKSTRVEMDGGKNFTDEETHIIGNSNFLALMRTSVSTDANGETTHSGFALSSSNKDEKTTVTEESLTTQLDAQWSSSNWTHLNSTEKKKSVKIDHDITSGHASLEYDQNGEEVWSGSKTTQFYDFESTFKEVKLVTPPNNSGVTIWIFWVGDRVYWDDVNDNGVDELHIKSVEDITIETTMKKSFTKELSTLKSDGEYESPVDQPYSTQDNAILFEEEATSYKAKKAKHVWNEHIVNSDWYIHTKSIDSESTLGDGHTYRKVTTQNGDYVITESKTTSGTKNHGSLVIDTTLNSNGRTENNSKTTDELTKRSEISTKTGTSDGEGGFDVTSNLKFERYSEEIVLHTIDILIPQHTTSATLTMDEFGTTVTGTTKTTISGRSNYRKKTENSTREQQQRDPTTLTVSGVRTVKSKTVLESDYEFKQEIQQSAGQMSYQNSRTDTGKTEISYDASGTQTFTKAHEATVAQMGAITGTAVLKVDITYHEEGNTVGHYIMSPSNPVSISASSVGLQTVNISLNDSYDIATESLNDVAVPTVTEIDFTWNLDDEHAHLMPFYYHFTLTIAYFDGYFDYMDHTAWLHDEFIGNGVEGLQTIDLTKFYVGFPTNFAEITANDPSFSNSLRDLLKNNYVIAVISPPVALGLYLYGGTAEEFIAQVGEEFENGKLFDRAIGAFDTILDSLNPIDNIWSIPDIGVQFGNEDAYRSGQTAGMVIGFTINVALAFVGPGLVNCGKMAHKAFVAYEFVSAVDGLVAGGKDIANGEVGLSTVLNIGGGLLSLRGAKKALGQCFVGDTLVVVPDEVNLQPRVAGLLPDAELEAEWNFSALFLAAISVPIGLTTVGLLERKKKKSEPFAKLDRLFEENDFHELWHPQTDVPRNSHSNYFPMNRGLEPELLSNHGSPLSTIKESQPHSRKQAEMHRPHAKHNSVPKRTRLAGGISVVGLIGVLATLLFSGSLFWMATPKTEEQKTPVIASSDVSLTHKRIQDIQPGQWVKADNPAEEDDTEFGKDVDPATWKLLKLKAPKLDGTLADVSLLRPDYWLTLQSATIGGTVYISVPECGIDGNAKVLEISDCPPIAANPGPGFQIVTGTFQHQAAKILDIGVESESKPIGTTPNHPFWSVDRQAFVRADSLTVGERLQNLNGITIVTSITSRGPPEPVYNLEVQVKHTYYVADSGVLVHNGGVCTKQVDPGKLRAGAEKSTALTRTLDKLRNQIAKYGFYRTWPKSDKIYGIQDKFGNIQLLEGVTRALRVNHFNRTLKLKLHERVKIDVEVKYDKNADFRRLWKISDFPSP